MKTHSCSFFRPYFRNFPDGLSTASHCSEDYHYSKVGICGGMPAFDYYQHHQRPS